jgi:hypothetical protein
MYQFLRISLPECYFHGSTRTKEYKSNIPIQVWSPSLLSLKYENPEYTKLTSINLQCFFLIVAFFYKCESYIYIYITKGPNLNKSRGFKLNCSL